MHAAGADRLGQLVAFQDRWIGNVDVLGAQAAGQHFVAQECVHARPAQRERDSQRAFEHRARFVIRNPAERILRTVHGSAVDREQQVARQQPGLLSGAADVQVADDYAALGEAGLHRLLIGDVLGHDADPPADDAAMRDDVAQHAAHHVHGDGEADSLDAQALGDNRGVDADERAARVDERAARVAEVDRRVGLDEVLQRRDAELLAAREADDPMRHGLRQPDRVADGEHDVPDFELVRAPEGRHRQTCQIDLEDRQIRVGVAADNARVGDPPVGQLHLDRAGIHDHVMVGDDVAALVDDDSRAEAAFDALPVTGQIVSEQLAQRGRRDAFRHQPGRVNVHDGGSGALNGRGIGHAHRGRCDRRRRRRDGRRRGGRPAPDEIRAQCHHEKGEGKPPYNCKPH